VLLAWTIIVRSPSFTTAISDPDESFFLIIGKDWLHGFPPYIGMWDVKPPGLFGLFALTWLIPGTGVMLARVLTSLAVAATATGLFRLGKRHFTGDLVPIAAAVLYPLYTIVMTGLRSAPELLLEPLVVLGIDLAMTLHRSLSPDGRRATLSGVLFGLAFTIKQTAAFEAVFAALLIAFPGGLAQSLRHERLRATARFAVGGACPALLFVGYFTLVSNDIPLGLSTILGGIQRLRGDDISFLGGMWRFLPMLKPMLPLFIGVLILWSERRDVRMDSDARSMKIIAAWCLTSAGATLAMRSVYPQYFLPLEAPLVIVAACAIRTLSRKARTSASRSAWSVGLVLLTGAYPIAWLGFREWSELRSAQIPTKVVAEMNALGLSPSDQIFVADYDPVIYLLADKRPPSRYFFAQHLLCDFRLPDTDQATELDRIMSAGPKFVVIAHDRKRVACERADRTAIVDRYLKRSYILADTITVDGDAVDVYLK
jgi:hypothetical protein